MTLARQVKIVFANLIITDSRVRFKVEKSLVGYPNLSLIEIYNLTEDQRNQIEEKFSRVELSAGNENLSLMFSGDIINVIHRYIKPDWITEVYGGDASRVLNDAIINKVIPAGSTVGQIYDELIDTMEGITKGITEGLSNCVNGKTSILRNMQLSGSVKDFLLRLAADCGFDYAITNDVIETTVQNEPLLDVPPILINQSTGMIGSPERTDEGVTVKNLLIPDLKLGRRIEIKATSTEINVGNLFFRKITPDKLNSQGVYRVDKIIHTGDTNANTWQSEIISRKPI